MKTDKLVHAKRHLNKVWFKGRHGRIAEQLIQSAIDDIETPLPPRRFTEGEVEVGEPL